MDWVEIRDMLGLSITPDQLRKQAVGYLEYDNYMDGKLTKPQKEGFAVICQDKNGNLIDSKTKIVSLN